MVTTRHGVIPINPGWLGKLPTVAREKDPLVVLNASAEDRALLVAVAAMTDHERNILRSRSQGLCNREIGYHYGISEQTVKNILTIVWKKLDLPRLMENKSGRACYLLGIYDTLTGVFDELPEGE